MPLGNTKHDIIELARTLQRIVVLPRRWTDVTIAHFGFARLSLSIKARNPAQPFIWKWISRLKVIGKGLILILYFSGRVRHLFLDADEGDCDDCWRARLYHYVGEQLRTKGSNISCASCTLQRILIHLHVPLHICHAHRSYEPFGE